MSPFTKPMEVSKFAIAIPSFLGLSRGVTWWYWELEMIKATRFAAKALPQHISSSADISNALISNAPRETAIPLSPSVPIKVDAGSHASRVIRRFFSTTIFGRFNAARSLVEDSSLPMQAIESAKSCRE
jgi:hypothetical protein